MILSGNEKLWSNHFVPYNIFHNLEHSNRLKDCCWCQERVKVSLTLLSHPAFTIFQLRKDLIHAIKRMGSSLRSDSSKQANLRDVYNLNSFAILINQFSKIWVSVQVFFQGFISVNYC